MPRRCSPRTGFQGEKAKPPLKTSGPKAKGEGWALGSNLGAQRNSGDGGRRVASWLRQICQELGTSQRGKKEPVLKGTPVGFEIHPQEGMVPTAITAHAELHHMPKDPRDIQGFIQLASKHRQGAKMPVHTRGICSRALRLVPAVTLRLLQQARMLQGHQNRGAMGGVWAGLGVPSTQSSLGERGVLSVSPELPP